MQMFSCFVNQSKAAYGTDQAHCRLRVRRAGLRRRCLTHLAGMEVAKIESAIRGSKQSIQVKHKNFLHIHLQESLLFLGEHTGIMQRLSQ